jgi:hypothetical protein
VKISCGKRYLLVGFCFTKQDSPYSSWIEGNISLDLIQQKGTKSIYGVWSIVELLNTVTSIDKLSLLVKESLSEFPGEPMKRSGSHWIGCSDAVFKGSLAEFAQKLFWFHVNRIGIVPGLNGGAEYWFQHLKNENCETTNCDYIPWHYDKDEVLFFKDGIERHPDISTVTYLTGGNLPTVVFSSTEDSALVSYPRFGKHIAFSGRYLHGCPSLLKYHLNSSEDYRVTFLVNIWLNSPPTACSREENFNEIETNFASFDVLGKRETIEKLSQNVSPETWKEVHFGDTKRNKFFSSPERFINSLASNSTFLSQMINMRIDLKCHDISHQYVDDTYLVHA